MTSDFSMHKNLFSEQSFLNLSSWQENVEKLWSFFYLQSILFSLKSILKIYQRKNVLSFIWIEISLWTWKNTTRELK